MKKYVCLVLLLCLLFTGCHADAPESDASAPKVTTTDSTAATTTTEAEAVTTATTQTTATTATSAAKATTTSGKKVTTTSKPLLVDTRALLNADPDRAPSNDLFPLSFACSIHDGYVYYFGGPNTLFPERSTLYRKPLTGDGEAEKVLAPSANVHSFRYAVCGDKLYYLDSSSDARSLYVCDLDGSNAKLLINTGQYNIDVDFCYVTKDWIIYTCEEPDDGTQLYLLSTDGKTKKIGADLGKNRIPYSIRPIGFNRGYYYYYVSYHLKDRPSTVGAIAYRIDYRSQNPVQEELTDYYNGMPIDIHLSVHNDKAYRYTGGTFRFATLLDEKAAVQTLDFAFSHEIRLWDYFVYYNKDEYKCEYMGWQGERKTVQLPKPESGRWAAARPAAVPNTNYLYCWLTTENTPDPSAYSATSKLVLFDPDGNLSTICEITV